MSAREALFRRSDTRRVSVDEDRPAMATAAARAADFVRPTGAVGRRCTLRCSKPMLSADETGRLLASRSAEREQMKRREFNPLISSTVAMGSGVVGERVRRADVLMRIDASGTAAPLRMTTSHRDVTFRMLATGSFHAVVARAIFTMEVT